LVVEQASAADPYRQYRRTLLSGDELRGFAQLRPWRPVMDVAILWLQIAAAWTAVALWTRWWVVLLALPVIGTRYYALFIVGHDGMHRRLFRSSHLNDRFCDLFILGPIGALTHINKRNHLEHHRHLATELDPDRHKHACFNKASQSEYLFFLTGLASVLPVFANVFGRERETSTKESTAYGFADVAILVGWQVVLIGGLSWAIGWWAYPVLWLLPVYVHTYLADLVRSFLEHSHPESDERADEHRLVTYLSNPMERALFAPRNMNYHAAHHLWPAIPYYNLPRADALIRERRDSAGLVWRGSYVGYLVRYFLALPLAECRTRRA
jgi:fatty acid desaturase